MKDERQLLSQSDLARHFGVHPSRIQALSAQGRIEMVKKVGRACMYYLDEVEDVFSGSCITAHKSKIQDKIDRTNRPKKTESVSKNLDDPQTLTAAKTLNEQLKAKLKRLELDKKKGLLLSARDVETEWASHISSAKIQLLGMTSKMRPMLNVYIQDDKDIRKVLKEIDGLINQLLIDLSGGNDG